MIHYIHASSRLKRTEGGGFEDHDLAKVLLDATDTMACAYGARGIPSVMKAVEVMGIKQARKWGVCTMNEFRQFIGLKRFESFEEWNPTGDIAVRVFFSFFLFLLFEETLGMS